MTAFLVANLAPVMFLALVVFLLSGFPIAFALAANGLLFAFIGFELGLLEPSLLQALPNRLYGIMSNETLLAVPFFTFMGLILERSGMAEDLLDTIGQLFGTVRGGVAYAVIFVGALLASTTGVVAASVISMGLISLPIMMRYGYDQKVATGVIAASGTLAQIIPPSLVLIVMADQLGRSVGDMYKAALLPGLLLPLMYALYVLLVSIFRPQYVPALPASARKLREPDGSAGVTSLVALLAIAAAASYVFIRFRFPDPAVAKTDEVVIYGGLFGIGFAFVVACVNRYLKIGLLSVMAEKVVFVMVPPLMLIFAVLGSIFVGIATPTEGGGMGAAGAMALALANRRLSWLSLKQALQSTTRLTSFVIFILVGASLFSLTFRAVNGDLWVEHLLTSLPGGNTGFLIGINILFFVLAFFLDFFELAFILVPLIAPVAEKLGIDLVWLGVLLSINIQTSFMHPPFGFSLFYLRSVAPREVKTSSIYLGAIPFLAIQVALVAAVILFPGLIHTGAAVDMKEKLELRIDRPADSYSPGSAPANPYGPGSAPAPDGAPANPYGPGSAPANPYGPANQEDASNSPPVFSFSGS